MKVHLPGNISFSFIQEFCFSEDVKIWKYIDSPGRRHIYCQLLISSKAYLDIFRFFPS